MWHRVIFVHGLIAPSVVIEQQLVAVRSIFLGFTGLTWVKENDVSHYINFNEVGLGTNNDI